MANRLTTAEAQEFIDELGNQFSERFKLKVPRTLVKLKTVYETWAGICYPGMIYVNRGIMKDVDIPFMKEILAHELAHHITDSTHYLDCDRYPVHGKVWKSVARAIGAFPTAFHWYPTAPFIMNNMDKFWCYEYDGLHRWVGAEEKAKKGNKFWSNGKLWKETENKNEAIDKLDRFEREYTSKEIERRLKTISMKKTFWRDHVK